ncbi:MAG: hypothetical protein WCQ64_07350 [Acidobacteriota bacterium]
MTQDRRDDQQQDAPAGQKGRRTWRRPALTAYGPIGKLTQGGTGSKTDSSSGRKSTCL